MAMPTAPAATTIDHNDAARVCRGRHRLESIYLFRFTSQLITTRCQTRHDNGNSSHVQTSPPPPPLAGGAAVGAVAFVLLLLLLLFKA